MKKLAAILGLLFALLIVSAPSAKAQTTYNSIEVSINTGDPSWATFYFGHAPNGTPGTTALIIQCDFDRAELITNFDVYGRQMTSQFFSVTCTRNGPFFEYGQRIISYTVYPTPLHPSLLMTGTDSNGNKVTQNLNLTIHSAGWTMEGYGSGTKDTGSAEIAY